MSQEPRLPRTPTPLSTGAIPPAGDGPHNLLRDGLMTIPEAAAFLRLSRSTLYSLMEKGELLYVQIGGARRIPRRALIELAAAHLKGTSTAGSPIVEAR